MESRISEHRQLCEIDFNNLKDILKYQDRGELQRLAYRCLNQDGYKEYLQSPYWIIVKNYILSIRKQCHICKRTTHLTVHHKTYEHFGYEIFHLEDLEVLCWFCHIEERGKRRRPTRIGKTAHELIEEMREKYVETIHG